MSTRASRGRQAVALSSAVLAGVAAALLLVRTAPLAVAESGPIVADWQMNEVAGAVTMTDGSGNAITGSIGLDVTSGVVYDGETGYRFPEIENGPANEPVNLERLVQVSDNDNLEPGDRDLFVAEFTYRTTRSFGNVLQKGQNSGPGGYWKFELPRGEVTCLFQGPPIIDEERGDPENGFRYWPRKALRTPDEDDPETTDVDENIEYDDGEWHTVRCELDRDNPSYPFGILRLYVDDMVTPIAVNALTEELGAIDNDAPLTVGGKANCDQISTTCDYFDGDVGYVTIERSGDVVDPPPTTTTTTTVPPTTTTTTAPTTTTTTTAPATTTTTVVSQPPGGGDGIGAATAGALADRGEASPLP